ncbi:MAG: EamA family transporter [Alteromonadaceae bacterium]|nr:EamA family transporter [Alteromonadaceae bacterium]
MLLYDLTRYVNKKWFADVPPTESSLLIMSLGGLILLPFLLFFNDLTQVAWQQSQFWQALLYLTLFTTMATFFLQQHLLQRVGPNHLLAFTYLIPILVVIPQQLSIVTQLYYSLPSIILTLLALYLISRQQR